ncbi:MAG: class I SAM-dependent methyltransferase, partial [Candidatus Hydrogenedentes bacterium]|nr:class I SAM-dependent methyltransferase [Candidatus Hydrogenedentota bacterium]
FSADLCHLPLKDACIDGVFCLHVLEHILDDKGALGEVYRVLKPGGTAVIMVPFMMDWLATVEFDAPDPDIFDHVRGYSPMDFQARLDSFEIKEIRPSAYLSKEARSLYRLKDDQVIFLCARR